MAARHGRLAPVGEYQPFNITTAATGSRIGSTIAHGTWLGQVIINQPGTGVTITLYSGDPAHGGTAFATIVPTSTVGAYPFWCAVDGGLFYSVAGTGIGNYTITYLDMAV